MTEAAKPPCCEGKDANYKCPCGCHKNKADPFREQDVDRWVRELKAAGWQPIAYKRGGPIVVEMSTTWRSPNGLLYRGPYLAWRVMQDPAYERTNDGR